MNQTCFPDAKQVKQYPKTILCKECTYVQIDQNESEDNFDSPPDNEPTFNQFCFQEGYVFDVETIEERLRDMNVHSVYKKGE